VSHSVNLKPRAPKPSWGIFLVPLRGSVARHAAGNN
jgi:hypothetical protein